MPRLTAELIHTSPQFVNPLKERELDLRGNKIPQIENLGAAEDQFDVVDLSDNDVARLEGFPLMSRLSSLFVANNRVASIASGLGARLPSLRTLVLANNRLEALADLDALASLTSLTLLSVVKNPVAGKAQYRIHVIARLPQLQVLDFKKVTAQERTQAAAYAQLHQLTSLSLPQPLAAGGVGGLAALQSPQQPPAAAGLNAEEKQQIRGLIERAETMEEIQRLEQALASGKLPKELVLPSASQQAVQ